MKRIVGFMIAAFVIFIVYHDLTTGTLSLKPELYARTATASPIKDKDLSQTGISSFQIKEVRAGDTVLSIVESLSSSPLTATVPEMVKDFERLNKGVKAEEIQIGKAYKFPVY